MKSGSSASQVGFGSKQTFTGAQVQVRSKAGPSSPRDRWVRRPLSTSSATGGNGGSGGNGSGSGGSGGGGSGGNNGGSGSGWHGVLWAAYLSQLDKNPVVTKSVTSGILNGFGDILAQIWLGEEGQNFEWKRLGIFTLLGMVFIGPVLHVWYGTLAKLFTGVGTATAVSKLAMDQLLFAPVFIGSIISLIMVLEGHGEDVPAKLKGDLFTIVKSNWALWVPFNFINFRYVPQSLQVLASNGAALLWNTYVSWASHSHAGDTSKE